MYLRPGAALQLIYVAPTGASITPTGVSIGPTLVSPSLLCSLPTHSNICNPSQVALGNQLCVLGLWLVTGIAQAYPSMCSSGEQSIFAAFRYGSPPLDMASPQCFLLVMQISIEPTFHSVDDAAVDISDSLISIDNDGQVTVGGGGGGSSGGGARPTG